MAEFSRQDLLELIKILNKHSNWYHADFLSKLLDIDPKSDEFFEVSCALEIWGGAGSLLDQVFVPTSYPIEEVKKDGKPFRVLLHKLASYIDTFDHPRASYPLARLGSRWLLGVVD